MDGGSILDWILAHGASVHRSGDQWQVLWTQDEGDEVPQEIMVDATENNAVEAVMCAMRLQEQGNE